MNGVRVAVHQSSSFSDRRKLFSITASPSVAVVAEMAPRWMTASSLRPASQSRRAAGGTKSASWRFCRLRHLPSLPSVSLTTTSVRPASLRSATTFDPMKPAPPVTKSIETPSSFTGGFSHQSPTLCNIAPLAGKARIQIESREFSVVSFARTAHEPCRSILKATLLCTTRYYKGELSMNGKVELSEPISLRLPVDTLAAIEKVAEACDRTRSWVIVRALRRYLMTEGSQILDVIEGRAQIAAGD